MKPYTRPNRDPIKAAGTLTRAGRAFLLGHAKGQNPAVPDCVWHGKDSWLLEHTSNDWRLSAFAREVMKVVEAEAEQMP